MAERIKNLRSQFKSTMALSVGKIIKKGAEWREEHTYKSGQNEQLQLIADDTITYDPNEIEDKKQIFGKEIVDGMVCAAFVINAIANEYEGNVLIYTNSKFLKPVYFGEKTLTVMKVIDTIPLKRWYTVETKIYRPDGQIAAEIESQIWSFNQNVKFE